MTAELVPDVAVPAADDTARLLPAVGHVDLEAHLARVGPVPYRGGPGLLAKSLDGAGLTGRGGAGFPTARKVVAVAGSRTRAVVVANAAEGEPASAKDCVLLTVNPHLVLDGLQLAAEAVRADTAYVYVHPDDTLVASVRRAVTIRRRAAIDRCRVEVVAAAPGFVAGEESAVVAAISGRRPLPTTKPPMVFESGVDGRPTLVQNVETLAHVALVARFGPDWFRGLGSSDQPGTMLLTVTGAVNQPGVVELPTGTSIRAVADAAGRPSSPVQAVLIGGYHGTWVAGDVAVRTALSAADLAKHGATVGAGVIGVLPVGACGVVESARIARYLAGESAGQCGPCVFGLPSIAEGLETLARRYPDPQVRVDLERRVGLVERRGACHHPDGTARFVRSALRVFAGELEYHARGTCTASRHEPVLAVPGATP